jgi:transcriptional regulator with XRE-family HTH domain
MLDFARAKCYCIAMKLFREALGEVLREERLSQEKTLRTLSSQATIALGYLSEVERGQKELSSEILFSIATHGLGLDTHEIVIRAGLRMAGMDYIPDTPQVLVEQYTDLVPQN